MKMSIYLIIHFVILCSCDIYSQWFTQESGTTDLLYGIKFVDINNGWVTNLNGTKLYHTTNGGTEWFVQKDFGTGVIWNFTFIDDSIGYIYSHGGPAHLLKTTDGGTTWQIIHTFSSTVDDLKFYNEYTGWSIETELNGYLSKTTNGGFDWEGFDYFNTFNGIFGKIGLIDENSIIITALSLDDGNIIFKTSDGGTTWTEIPVTDNLIGGRIQFIDENIGWIESDFKLYKTTDGGYNWQMQVESVHDFFFVNENLGWYIINNQIYRTTDGGDSWISQFSGTNNALYTLSFFDQNNGWISGDSGTILYTPNGGIPVELTSFTSDVSGNDIYLNWATASEINNKGFEVERSLKSKLKSQIKWTKTGFVEGHGTTAEKHIYSFTDNDLPAGGYFYRLKQIDYDGACEYSDIVGADVNPPDELILFQNYPNPFNPSTTIEYQIPNMEFVTLKIYDVLGNEIVALVNEEKPAGAYSVKIDGSKLSSGIYFYQLKAGDYIATKKLILLK